MPASDLFDPFPRIAPVRLRVLGICPERYILYGYVKAASENDEERNEDAPRREVRPDR